MPTIYRREFSFALESIYGTTDYCLHIMFVYNILTPIASNFDKCVNNITVFFFATYPCMLYNI